MPLEITQEVLLSLHQYYQYYQYYGINMSEHIEESVKVPEKNESNKKEEKIPYAVLQIASELYIEEQYRQYRKSATDWWPRDKKEAVEFAYQKIDCFFKASGYQELPLWRIPDFIKEHLKKAFIIFDMKNDPDYITYVKLKNKFLQYEKIINE